MTIHERARRAANTVLSAAYYDWTHDEDSELDRYTEIIANEFADLASEIDELRRLLERCRKPVADWIPMNEPSELLASIDAAIGKEPERE